VENPGALTPIRHTNLALNNAGVMGSILVDFPILLLLQTITIIFKYSLHFHFESPFI